jgi:hypothetical protein
MKDQESAGAHYSLLKAITYSIKGYDEQSVSTFDFVCRILNLCYFQSELLETAAQFFKTFGESSSDCDTIAGRQSMASGK